jgi:hypothetical protein
VQRRRLSHFEGRKVRRRRIAFVSRKIKPRIVRIHALHEGVAEHLARINADDALTVTSSPLTTASTMQPTNRSVRRAAGGHSPPARAWDTEVGTAARVAWQAASPAGCEADLLRIGAVDAPCERLRSKAALEAVAINFQLQLVSAFHPSNTRMCPGVPLSDSDSDSDSDTNTKKRRGRHPHLEVGTGGPARW